MDELLGGAGPTIQYDFAAVEGWYDRVPGSVGCLDEIFIPVNPDGNHWNFIHVKMQEKRIELWDSLGLRASNSKYLAATEKFVKDALISEAMTGRTAANHNRHSGWESTDRSGDSPRQEIKHDCGIFTLTSMCLIRDGLRLSRGGLHARHPHAKAGKEAPH